MMRIAGRTKDSTTADALTTDGRGNLNVGISASSTLKKQINEMYSTNLDEIFQAPDGAYGCDIIIATGSAMNSSLNRGKLEVEVAERSTGFTETNLWNNWIWSIVKEYPADNGHFIVIRISPDVVINLQNFNMNDHTINDSISKIEYIPHRLITGQLRVRLKFENYEEPVKWELFTRWLF